MKAQIENGGMTALDSTPVEVRAPKVVLQLKQIMYLRGLATGDVTCSIDYGSRDKMLTLGLIKEEVVPYTAEENRRFKADTDTSGWTQKAKDALKNKDWSGLSSAAHRLQYPPSRREPKKKLVITDCGRRLIKDGTLVVKVSKSGCKK